VPELRRTAPTDRYFDYCLQPYRPRRPPEGKLRSDNLLLETLAQAGLLDAALPVVEALQRGLGRDMVVWGAKHDGARYFWELYVYDPQREAPEASVAGLTELLAPHLRVVPTVRETVPTMMVSFDLDADVLASGEVRALNLYLTGTDEHMGRSYVVTEDGAELDNTYRFLRPKPDVDLVLGLLQSSLFVDLSDPVALARVIPPELFACKRVCVAKKRHRDGVYFSGIDVEQLLWFLRRHGYPAPLIRFVDTHAADLDHLYFDVGLDYAPGEDGVRFVKTSFYGTF